MDKKVDLEISNYHLVNNEKVEDIDLEKVINKIDKKKTSDNTQKLIKNDQETVARLIEYEDGSKSLGVFNKKTRSFTQQDFE